MNKQDKITGCLVGGAVGDALGAAVEFIRINAIQDRYGQQGITSYDTAYGRKGAITDDTQMTLFTLEGLLQSLENEKCPSTSELINSVYRSYIRWYGTQGYLTENPDGVLYSGTLWNEKQLHSLRAPGNTCLSALGERIRSKDITKRINNSKGCGTVMRMAPVGFFEFDDIFLLGCEFAKLTHSHPSGYLSAGFLAYLINCLLHENTLTEAINRTIEKLITWDGHDEVLNAVNQAVEYAKEKPAEYETIELLGGGWVAEEALAISLFCALKAKKFADGVILAVNHSGDSDSTGSITGNILGMILGKQSIPETFLADLELRDVIGQMAREAADIPSV